MRDIAAKAGVSVATVSLVIQRKGNLKETTRHSVFRAIEEMGYKRRSKRDTTKGNKNFALIVDDITNPYFHELFKGVDSVLADAENYLSMLSSYDSIERQTNLLNDLWDSEIGGVILVPASGTRRDDLLFFENRLRPMIMAVRRIGQSPFDYVGANPLVGMQLAADHLIALGHHRIGFVGGYKTNHAYSERYAGFVASLVRYGLELHPEWIVNGGSTREFGRGATKKLLSQKTVPSAVIAYNDLVAFGVMDAIRAADLNPGEDIAIIGYDDVPEATLQPVPLTSVATPADKLGEVIGQAILTKAVGDIAKSPLDITYPPRLVIRSSCGHERESSKRVLHADLQTA